MLAIAPLLGLAAAPAPCLASFLVFPGLLLLFLARYAALPAATRIAQGKTNPPGFVARRFLWTGIYASAAVAALASSLLLAPGKTRSASLLALTLVLVLGLLHAALALVGRDREAWAELLGMTGLAAAGPLVAFAGETETWAAAFPPGILALAFSASSLSWVRAWRDEKPAQAVASHLALAGALAATSWAGLLPRPAALVFAVPLLRLVWGLASRPSTLRELGFRELGCAVVYLVAGMAAVWP
jgi:hypothetical protein